MSCTDARVATLQPHRARTAEGEAYTARRAEGKAATRPPLDCSGDRPPAPRAGRSTRLHAGQDGARRHQDRQQRNRRRSAAQRAGGDRQGYRRHQPLPPTTGNVELKERLAKHLDHGAFAPEHISVGSGSVSLCQQLIQITASVGDEVMFGWRSFEIYPLQVRTAGATPLMVALTDYTFDLDAMLAAITDRTRLIFICNPNNPTSTVVDPRCAGPLRGRGAERHSHRHRRGVRRIHSRCDAARQLRPGSSAPQCRCAADVLEGLRSRRPTHRVCPLATPDVITALSKVYVPFTATSVSQAAAIASIDGVPTSCLARTDAVVEERARVSAALRDAGFTVPPSQANFVWLPLAERTAEFVKQCRRQPGVGAALMVRMASASPWQPPMRTTPSSSSPPSWITP